MMKRVANHTTKSLCSECAEYQICIENQLNIPSEFKHNTTHAWCIVYVEFKGKAYMQKWENGYQESDGMLFAILRDSIDHYGGFEASNEERLIKCEHLTPVPNSKLKAHTYLH